MNQKSLFLTYSVSSARSKPDNLDEMSSLNNLLGFIPSRFQKSPEWKTLWQIHICWISSMQNQVLCSILWIFLTAQTVKAQNPISGWQNINFHNLRYHTTDWWYIFCPEKWSNTQAEWLTFTRLLHIKFMYTCLQFLNRIIIWHFKP